jgi:hypothetical protein
VTTSLAVKVFVYGTSNSAGNWSLGKVEKATHYNRRRNPFATSETWIDVPIEETFVYGGRGGRVSSRTMKLNNYYTFTQGATWGPLGELTQETYPRCNAGFACADLAAARVQSYGYDRGDLTGIPGWGSLSYHDNGMLAAANHSNGVIDAIDKDPWQMPRPRNIRIPPARRGLQRQVAGFRLRRLRQPHQDHRFRRARRNLPAGRGGGGILATAAKPVESRHRVAASRYSVVWTGTPSLPPVRRPDDGKSLAITVNLASATVSGG